MAVDLSAIRNLGGFLFVAWLAILVFLFVPPKDPPGSAPARRLDIAPVCGMPLSGHFREPVPCINVPGVGQRDTPFPDEWDPVPLTHEDRFSPHAIGPDGAWAEYVMSGCPVSRKAVHEQGIGD